MANRKEHPAGYRIKEELAHDKTRAVEMRLAGKRWDEIAERISESTGRPTTADTVRRWVNDQLASTLNEAAAELRAQEVAKLDKYLAALDDIIEHGAYSPHGESTYLDESKRIQAIAAATRLSQRRAKLLGLDAPTQVEVATTFEGTIEQEIARLNAELYGADSAEAEETEEV